MSAGGLPTHSRAEMDALLNTYATGSAPGVWLSAAGMDLVGENKRKILIRDDPGGVYVGGVLVTDPADLRDFAQALMDMAQERVIGMHSTDAVAGQ